MMYGIVYKITNKVNNKCYIGQTTSTLETRWLQHKSAAKTNSQSGCRRLIRAMRKHGIDQFNIEQIASSYTKEALEEAEQFSINFYNAINDGYNCTTGGRFSTSQSEETRLKKSYAQKLANEKDPTLISKRSKGLKQFWLESNPDKLKERSNKIKASWTEERKASHGKRVSERQKGKFNPAAIEARKLPIVVTSLDTQIETTFKSCSEACRTLNLSNSAVSRCLKGDTSQHKGYQFKFLSTWI